MLVRRYLVDQIRRDLARKMVFVAGPRQVGKTTLAGHLELLMVRLPELVGSALSINALREDLRVSHKAAAS